MGVYFPRQMILSAAVCHAEDYVDAITTFLITCGPLHGKIQYRSTRVWIVKAHIGKHYCYCLDNLGVTVSSVKVQRTGTKLQAFMVLQISKAEKCFNIMHWNMDWHVCQGT